MLTTTATITSIYFLLRNKIDFLLLFLLSTLLYNWQIISGTIWVPPYTFPASEQSKVIISIVLAVLLFFAIVNDVKIGSTRERKYDKSKEGDELIFFYLLLIFSYLSTAYAAYAGWGNLLSGKAEFLRSTGMTYYLITYFPAAMTFLYALTSKRYSLASWAIIPLLFYVFVGFRAAMAVCLACGFFILYYNQKIFRLRNFIPILVMLLIFAAFVLYKISYIDLKLLNFDTISRILELDSRFDNLAGFLLYAFFSAEFGQQASNLSLTSSQNLSDYYSFNSAVVGSIPVVDDLVGIGEQESRFSTVIEARANPGFSYGLGSSIWGEIFQAGGFVGVFIFSLIVVFIITQFNLAFHTSKESTVIFLYVLGFLAFYVHRNDFVLVIASIKNILFFTIFILFCYWLFKDKLTFYSKKN